MRLKPLNFSRRKQLDTHEDSVYWHLQEHDRKLADRHGDSVFQRLNKRLFEATEPAHLPDVPERWVGSLQAVKIFRPLTMADTVHPEDRHFFDADELSEVIDSAAPKNLSSAGSYRHVDYVENSDHGALVKFQTEAQEKADIAHQKKLDDRAEKLKRRAMRAGHKVAQDLAEPVDEYEAKEARKEAEKWAGVRRERSAEIRDRLQFGFFYPGISALGGGEKIAGESLGAFSEFFGAGVLRSHLGSPSLARMTSHTAARSSPAPPRMVSTVHGRLSTTS